MARPTLITTARRAQAKALDEEHYRRQGRIDEALLKIANKPMQKVKGK